MSDTASTTVTKPSHLTVSSTADLVAVVPYLLGFQPEQSLVLLVFQSSRLQVGARLDLDAVHHPDAFRRRVGSLQTRFGPLQCAILAYTDDAALGRLACEETIAALPGADILDVARVSGDRYWGLLCDCELCRSEGHPFDSSASMAAATAVHAGLQVLASRDDAVSAAHGPVGPDLADAQERYRHWSAHWAGKLLAQRRERARELVSRYTSGTLLDLDELAELGVLVKQTRVRNEAFEAAMHVPAQVRCDLWAAVVAGCPDAWATAPLCMLGLAAWRLGNGALMCECVTRAETLSPDETLVRLLGQCIDKVVPPDADVVA